MRSCSYNVRPDVHHVHERAGIEMRTRLGISTVLLVLAGAVMALSVFDWVVLIDVPFLRNPAAVTAIVLMVMFAGTRLSRLRIRKGPVRWGIGFLALATVIELLRPLLPITSLDIVSVSHFMQWVQPVMLFVVVSSLSEDGRAFKYVWGGVVLAGVFMSLAVHLSIPLFTIKYIDTGRYGFNGVNLNAQAYWYALTGITLLWVILTRWPRFKWQEMGLAIAFFSVLLGLLGTASRSGFIALMTGLIIVLSFSLSKRKASAYVLLVPILIAVGVSAVVSNDLVLDRLGQAVDGTQMGGRDTILEAAWPKIKERYWTGYGPRYSAVLGEAMNTASGIKAAHNTYVQISMSFGVPVLLLWISLVLSLSRRLWDLRHEPIGVLFLSLLICTIVYSLVSDLGYRRLTWVMFALAVNAPMFANRGIGSAALSLSTRYKGQVSSALLPGQQP